VAGPEKVNLPDELVMTSYFSIRNGEIISLAVIFSQPLVLILSLSHYSVARKALHAAAVTVTTAPSRLVVSRIITPSADATSMQFPPSALL
jgi:hypothetical protein